MILLTGSREIKPLNILYINDVVYYPIYEFDGKYYISIDGDNIYSTVYKRNLKQQTKEGYLYNNMMLNGNLVKRFLHRMMAEVMLLKKDNRNIINHKNRNRKDNSIKNLEWVHRYENYYHGRGDKDYIDHNHDNHRLFNNEDIIFIYTCGLKYSEIKKKYPKLSRWLYQDILYDKEYKDVTKDLKKVKTQYSIRKEELDSISNNHIFQLWKNEYIDKNKGFRKICESDDLLTGGVLKRRIKDMGLPTRNPGRSSDLDLKLKK